MITHLELKNFAAFSSLKIDFSPRINIIIGENGTGKTQLLKAAYGLCSGAPIFESNPNINKKEIEKALTHKLLRLFMPLDDKLGKLHHQGATDQAYLHARFAMSQKITTTFFNNSKGLAIQDLNNYESIQNVSVFIPTKEILSLVKGMTDPSHDHKTVELIFDDGYVDLANALMQSADKDTDEIINFDPRMNAILSQLTNLIGGRYQLEDGGFCFQHGKYVEKPSPNRLKTKAAQMYQDSTVTEFVPSKAPLYSSSMTAEGFRKIGMLQCLVSSGVLKPGKSGPLFWDEPESNLNPKLVALLVPVMLELSRNGQQIILTTHEYVLLKWFNLLLDKRKEDHVRFHALYRDTQSGAIKVDSIDDYHEIERNPIAEAFNNLTIAHAKSRLKEVESE
jgi:AAA15 family ATPase/GTPase